MEFNGINCVACSGPAHTANAQWQVHTLRITCNSTHVQYAALPRVACIPSLAVDLVLQLLLF